MISIFVYFFSAIIILLAVLLVIYNWNINKNVVYLTAFLFIFALENSILTAVNLDTNNHLNRFFVSLVPLLFLKAPLLFLFVRGVAQDRFIFKWKDLLHFIPFLIVSILNFPALFLYFQENADIVRFLSSNPSYIINGNNIIDYPDVYVEIVLFIQFVFYITAAFVYVFKNRKHVRELTGQIRFQYQYTISRMFMLLVFITLITTIKTLSLMYLYYRIDNLPASDFFHNIPYVGLILYFLIPVYVMLNPKFLYGLPYLETHHFSAGQFEATNKEFNKLDNSLHQLANNEDLYFRELAGKIMDYIDIEKPFLNKNFKVDDLSKVFDVPHNHIHYCLNEIQQTKFNMLRNEKRVDYARELLKSSYENISIEEIGHMSGFTSVSSFYSTFKDVTGFTPVQWVKMNNNLRK